MATTRTPRPRRRRTIRESLLTIALGLEATLVLFITLTAFGLRALPPVAAFAGGAGLLLAILIAAGLQRFHWGHWAGWVVQVLLIATGVVLPIMFAIGIGFAGLWTFCYVKARQLENQPPPDEAPPTPSTTTEEPA